MEGRVGKLGGVEVGLLAVEGRVGKLGGVEVGLLAVEGRVGKLGGVEVGLLAVEGRVGKLGGVEVGLLAVEGRVGKLGGAEVGLLAVEGRVEFLTEQVGENYYCSVLPGLQCQLADVEQEKEGQILRCSRHCHCHRHLRTRHRFQASSVHQNLHGQLLLPVQAHSVPLQQSTT